MSFLIPNLKDIIDILIIAFLIYQLLRIIRKTGSYQLLYGLLFVFILYLLAVVINLQMVSDILNALKLYWILGFIIIFQPEIRSILSRLNISEEIRLSLKRKNDIATYGALIEAVSAMSFRRTGALIVYENKQNLDEFIHGGEIIDAGLSVRLILSIFNTKSALHDGAMIIRDNRILAAKVVLPLSGNVVYTKKYGTRHLAAVGISEVSDAVAIVVSEQTGRISLAKKGHIQSGIAIEELMQLLSDAIK